MEEGGRIKAGKHRGIETGIFPLISLLSEFDRQKTVKPVYRGAFDSRHSPVGNMPRDIVIECVNQDVSEGDYALVVVDRGNHGAVDPRELLHRQEFLSALSIARSMGS